MTLTTQIIWLFVLAIPIACVAWTVTHEQVFSELAEFCTHRSKNGETLLERKFFYLLTCEYCFSHYVTIAILIIAKYKLLFSDWRGYLISFFALVWVANIYMGLFALIRTDIKLDKTDIEMKKEEINAKQ